MDQYDENYLDQFDDANYREIKIIALMSMEEYKCSTPMELICSVVDALSELHTLSEIIALLNVKEVEDIKDGDLYDYLLEYGGNPEASFWYELVYINQIMIDQILGGESNE